LRRRSVIVCIPIALQLAGPNGCGGRFLGRDGPLQPANIAVVEQPADHVRRNLTRTLGIKLMGARESPRSAPDTSAVRVGLDHYYASEPVEMAVGMAIIQPERRHGPKCSARYPDREGVTLSPSRAYTMLRPGSHLRPRPFRSSY
jgi:hypothetical protein